MNYLNTLINIKCLLMAYAQSLKQTRSILKVCHDNTFCWCTSKKLPKLSGLGFSVKNLNLA